MEDMERQHQERHCEVLDGLNLKTFDSQYYNQMHHKQEDSFNLLTQLESNINRKLAELRVGRITTKKEVTVPKNENLHFVFINCYNDYKRNFQAVHKLRSSLRSLDISKYYLCRTYLNDLRRDLVNHMKLSSFLNHQRNVLSCYLTRVKDCCETASVLPDANSIVESQLLKFLTVCNLIPPLTEIQPSDGEEVIQYENLAFILRCCHQSNFTNSRIIVKLLRMILKMHLANSNDSGQIRHQIYDERFLHYVLRHIEHEGIDIDILLSQCTDTVWDFYSQFSVLNAMVNGNRDQMLLLLNSGVQIFPQYEQRKSGHNYPDISQTLTRDQLMILEIMERIHQKSLWKVADCKVSQEQRNCFEIIWQREPGTHISSKHFYQALQEEYDHLLFHRVEKRECEKRRREKLRLVKMYIDNFYDMPEADYTEIFISLSFILNMPL